MIRGKNIWKKHSEPGLSQKLPPYAEHRGVAFVRQNGLGMVPILKSKCPEENIGRNGKTELCPLFPSTAR